MNASGGGRFVALAGLTVLGVALGAFTAITFAPQVGAGIGITVGYLTWMALMGDRRVADRHRRRGAQGPLHPGPDHRHQQGDARVATETDAARDRVLAARAALGEELEILEASARAAVDVPAKIRRSPGKAAAVAGGDGLPRARRAAARLPRGPGGRSPARPSRCPSRCSPRRSRRRCASSATTAPRSAARSSATSPPTPQQAQRDRARLRTLLAPDGRPAAPVGARPRPRRAGCSAPTTRASRRGSRRSANAAQRQRGEPAERRGRRRRRAVRRDDAGRGRADARGALSRPARARAGARLRGGRVAEWQTRRP